MNTDVYLINSGISGHLREDVKPPTSKLVGFLAKTGERSSNPENLRT